jgi:CheY-like chemotaxis protein
MIQKEWPVLVVDDEPDVLEVTRLVLKDLQVDGVRLKLVTASSKAEAVQLLTQSSGPPAAPFIAVALIDVVMETDHAGLELCEYIRKTQKNSTTQLYIRTGQAGVAPERSVIDRYDINGYFTKIEAVQDKLYSVVKSGVRQHEFLTNSLVLFQILTQAAGQSRMGIAETLGRFADFAQRMARACRSRLAATFCWPPAPRSRKSLTNAAAWTDLAGCRYPNRATSSCQKARRSCSSQPPVPTATRRTWCLLA